ncbi:MAG: hypothetical protein Q8K26_00850, partial [Candidatus Gracilibacteria bacterium]|nr:hypothetical protein [Candidatus Gracilibacteria bacterium]
GQYQHFPYYRNKHKHIQKFKHIKEGDMVMIQRIWNGVCAPFVVMGMVFGMYGFMLPEWEGCILKTLRDEVVEFFHTIEETFLICIAFIMMIVTELIFPEKESVLEKRQPDVMSSNPTIQDDLIQLVAWSAFGILLSFGIICLIVEAWEGGVSVGGVVFFFGVLEFISFSVVLLLLVLPEIVRVMKRLGYVKAQLEKGRKAFL